MENGEIEIGYVSPDVAYSAFRGIGNYAGKKVPLRAVLRGHGAVLQLFTLAKKGIKTPGDISGHSYMFNMKGSPANISYGNTLIEFYKLKDVKVLTATGTSHMVYSVRDGVADVSQTVALGASSLIETSLTHKMHFIPLSPDAQKYMVEKNPWMEIKVIPAGTYKGQDKDVPAVGYTVTLYTMRDTPEDLIYMMTKALLDHTDEFSKYHARAKEWTLESALQSPVTAFHEGAIRYYKEKGIWTSEMDKVQENLLLAMRKAK